MILGIIRTLIFRKRFWSLLGISQIIELFFAINKSCSSSCLSKWSLQVLWMYLSSKLGISDKKQFFPHLAICYDITCNWVYFCDQCRPWPSCISMIILYSHDNPVYPWFMIILYIHDHHVILDQNRHCWLVSQ